ncbi:Variable outer membrane protein [Borrelia duttonii CR2A]|uniref:Variable large protein n=1 Tax=Borrelia duttonii CR2A TaxID=1432657 RepID=W6TJ61_9SPIR|nr:Variable outer membrane protein [Borrelia duttonii CR2A]
MNRMRMKGIILMMIVMGCNSGGVKDPEKVFLSEMVNLGKGFLDVFVSFGDMIIGTLGIKADMKKSDIGKYFSDIEKSMQHIVFASNADTKGVEAVIQSSSEVIEKLVASVTKLAGITKEGNVEIGVMLVLMLMGLLLLIKLVLRLLLKELKK